MAKIYKVWVHVEEIDEEEDTYEDVGLPYSVAEFDNLAEADCLAAGIANTDPDNH